MESIRCLAGIAALNAVIHPVGRLSLIEPYVTAGWSVAFRSGGVGALNFGVALRPTPATKRTFGWWSGTTTGGASICVSSTSGWRSDTDPKTVHYFRLFIKLIRTLLQM